ncbi:MAG: A/G-specific adenine glycosylase [Brucellaceae bacterium]|nr:A/G-specific adenine glycosylase [Brucellaceae bacterium]
MPSTRPIRKPTPPKTGPSDALLAWYDRHHRILPWRVSPAERARGTVPDPYRVWLSEIMLQQTTVKAVKPYFEAFTARWPTVSALAAASDEDIMKAWAGLGYYSRARNLKACAEAVVRDHNGVFPGSVEALKALPGIGDYAAAIAAIGFDVPAAVVDGNVERVMARLMHDTPLRKAKGRYPRPRRVICWRRGGDFAQVTMDPGATICTPKRPSCMMCPLNDGCAALAAGEPEAHPVKALKPGRLQRRGHMCWSTRTALSSCASVRPKGLLGGMSEVPMSRWTARQDGTADTSEAPIPADWRHCGAVSHVFTHFSLTLEVFRADVAAGRTAALEGWWSPPGTLAGEALPNLVRKAIDKAVPGAASPAGKKAQ